MSKVDKVLRLYWYFSYQTFLWLFFHINRLLSEAFEELIGFQNALKEFVGSADTSYAKKYEEFYVGFEGRLVTYLGVFRLLIYSSCPLNLNKRNHLFVNVAMNYLPLNVS